jgi:short-subunit dehydrogenase
MDKLLAITGGTKGIGKAIAIRFLEEGYRVIVCSRNEKNFEAMTRELNNDLKKFLTFFQADVSKKEQAEAFSEAVLDQETELGVLVNNAGIFLPGAIHSEPEGTLQTLMEANMYSAYWISRKLIPKMIREKQGHIFNICSTASIVPYENGGAYCVSKFALLAFSKLLRVELKEKGIKVTAVLPGATWTDSWNSSGMKEERFIPVKDIAEMVFSTYNLSPSTDVEEILIRPQMGDV